MSIEQLRAEFEAWAKGRGMTLHKASPCDGSPPYYLDTASIAAWEAYQAGRAALQSQEYTSAIGVAGEAYMDSFKYAHPLPVQFRWRELWEVMYAAANKGFPQSQDWEDAFCVWHNDPETDNLWDTDCRQLFEIYDGTPTENGMEFCCYCGKPIREAIDHARRVEGNE